MGQLLGTLAYMSPEQVTGDPIAIDTRSDVYALGVILYELLAGKSPYTLTRHLHEVVRTIQQVDPAPLGSVNRVYRGDIETIVAKALEKDKDRRYASAVELAADMRRYLEDQPITAKPASAGYQLQKFARRHKVLVASAATVFVVLAVGAMVSTWQAVLARRAEKRAHQQSEIARAVNDFLRHDLLAQASAYNQAKPDPDLKVRTALDRAAAQVEGRFEKQPLVEASIHNTIGSAYIDLGLYAEAQRQFERELALRRREMGEDHPDTLPAMGSLATVYERTGELKKAEPLYVKDLELQERTLGKDNPNTLKAMNGLAVTYMEEGRYAESAAIFGALVPREQRVFGEGDLQTLRAMGNLAALYDVEGKLAESETLLVSTLEKKRRFLGEYNPETLDSMSNLGDVYEKEGEYAKAEPLLVNAVAGYRRVLGESHSSTINAMTTLADLYRISGKTAQAETLATQTLVTARRSLGEAHHFTLDSMFVLAQVDLREGKEAQEEGLLNKVLEARRRTLGPEHPDTLAALVVLSEIRLRQRRFSEAGTFVREALEAYRKSMPDSWQGHMCQSLLGASLAGQKKLSEAEPLLISGYAGMLQQKSSIDASNHARLSQAGDRIVRFYKESGREDKAAEWKNKLPTN
jgi:tetratricopeptide (TPR) repeat protein